MLLGAIRSVSEESPMNIGKTLFAQLMDFLPWSPRSVKLVLLLASPVTLSLVQEGLVVASSTDTMIRPLAVLLVVYENVREEAGVPLPPMPLLSYAMVLMS